MANKQKSKNEFKYPFRNDYMTVFRNAGRLARENKLGLWADPPAKEVKKEKSFPPGTVFVTRTGKKYHKATCRFVGKSRIAISLADAKRRGFEPCRVCRP